MSASSTTDPGVVDSSVHPFSRYVSPIYHSSRSSLSNTHNPLGLKLHFLVFPVDGGALVLMTPFRLLILLDISDAVRQKGQVRCLLLAFSGQVPSKEGGKD